MFNFFCWHLADITCQWRVRTKTSTVEYRISNHKRELQFVRKMGRFEKAGVKLQWSKAKGNEFCFQKKGIFGKLTIREIWIPLYNGRSF